MIAKSSITNLKAQMPGRDNHSLQPDGHCKKTSRKKPKTHHGFTSLVKNGKLTFESERLNGHAHLPKRKGISNGDIPIKRNYSTGELIENYFSELQKWEQYFPSANPIILCKVFDCWFNATFLKTTKNMTRKWKLK
jgi:hypothetical protein